MKTRISAELSYIIGREALCTRYDGKNDDLLTGGAGFSGLQNGEQVAFKNPLEPGDDELRKRTIRNNYRALFDLSETFYGRFYGPGVMTDSPEKIPGQEIRALSDGGVSFVLQVPDTFNLEKPYLVAAPSSGSRCVYGAVGVVGEWALNNGFAVIYSDKGTGTGYHVLDKDTVSLLSGERCRADNAGDMSLFTAISETHEERAGKLSEYRKLHPHRIAVKHAHSGLNLQKSWGLYLLRSVEFAFTILQSLFGESEISRGKLKVIAAGISNGGLSSIMAAEQDTGHWIDAVVVSEPNVTPAFREELVIVQGNRSPVRNHSKHLADYMSLVNIYQPCATLADGMETSPLAFAGGVSRELCEARCESLRDKGLLKGDTISELAEDARNIIRRHGINEEQDILQPSHYALDVVRSVSYAYISQYGRFDVTENLCGYSYAAVDEAGDPAPLAGSDEAALFCDQAGIPPLGPVQLINDMNPEGPLEDRRSKSPSTGRMDMNLDGALRLRRLVTGVDESGRALTGSELERHNRVKQGMGETLVSANLRGKPTIIVTGRSDAILHVNHTSRAYVGVNALEEKESGSVYYYEVTNAHHLDVLNRILADPEQCDPPVFFAPLHYYYLQALNLMFDHLEIRKPLPESQVIRPVNPRKELPPIKNTPMQKDRIVFEDNTLFIPE